MYRVREYYRRLGWLERRKMDPNCAICHAPAAMACECEAKGLETAIRQAEARMMQPIHNDIRGWVRAHAQDYILEYFRLLKDRRQQAHQTHLDRIMNHAYHYYNAPPHPQEMTAAQAALKRGIDEDWQASVQRYPEVLEYFYSLVSFTLPSDDDPSVRDPPLSALNGTRHPKRGRSMGGGGGGTVASGLSMHVERDHPGGRRASPSRGGVDRRTTPGPSAGERRPSFQRPPPGAYYGGGGGYNY